MYTFSRKPIYQALLDAALRGITIKGIVDRGQFRSMQDLCNPTNGCELPADFINSDFENAKLDKRLILANDIPMFSTLSNSEKISRAFC